MDEMCAIPAHIQGSACPMSSHNLANRQEVQPLEISDYNICTIIFTHEIIRKLRYANSPIGVLQSLLQQIAWYKSLIWLAKNLSFRSIEDAVKMVGPKFSCD